MFLTNPIGFGILTFAVFVFQRKIMKKLANILWPIMANLACNWPYICFSFQAGIHQLSLVLHSTCGYHWQNPNSVKLSTFFSSLIFIEKHSPTAILNIFHYTYILCFEIWVLQTQMFNINENKNEKYNNEDCGNVMSSNCENLWCGYFLLNSH